MTATKPQIKEHPILFSGPMVKAIIEGRKTQTRRVVNPQPPPNTATVRAAQTLVGQWIFYTSRQDGLGKQRCPYGLSGDRLWVRETWAEQTFNQQAPRTIYRATDQELFGKLCEEGVRLYLDLKWRPSIFLPRQSSRITLEITGIRVERLQDISEEDAKAEGMKAKPIGDPANPDTGLIRSYRMAFAEGWNTINGKRPGCKWEDNPWVWVVEFRRLEAPCQQS